MPNFKTHAIAGVASGIGVTLYDYQKNKNKDPNVDFDFLQLLINIIAGFTGAALPDKLEPAYHPNHRSTCHSLSAAALNGWGMNVTENLENLDPRWKSVIKSLSFGYLSHLALDLSTPKGLPLLC